MASKATSPPAIPYELIDVLVMSVVVVALWALGKAFNFEFALLPSLAISAAATCLLTVVTRLISK